MVLLIQDTKIHKFILSLYSLLQVDAYIADPETTTTNRLIAQSYKDGLATGSFIQPVSFPHFFSNRRDLVLYRNQPWREGEEKKGSKNEPHTKL